MEIRRLQEKLNTVAIYCRLSKDDGSSNDSISIQNQKDVLTEYVQKQGWHIYDYYIDDGYSGTSFERPSFKRMLNDIERGCIQIVVTKDLSRLGRNYLQTGYYTEEYFPLKKVRYIALNDNFDTKNDDGNEIVPFKNLINEWYAKDISKKIRFTVSNKMKNGEYVRSVVPLYGYNFGDGKLEINPDTAPVVKYIFEEYIKTSSVSKICQYLTNKKIYTPSYYNYEKYGYNAEKFINYQEEDKYTWHQVMVIKILQKIEYTGALVRGKREKKFKQKKTISKDPTEWYIFENRFEAIITKEQFNLVRELSYMNKFSSVEINLSYKGLIYCGYCGKKLRLNKRNEALNQTSGGYRLSCRDKHEAGAGSINNLELEFVLKEEIKALRDFLLSKKEQFIEFIDDFNKIKKTKKKVSIDEVRLNTLKEKEEELSKYIRLAFESYAKGELPMSIYESMVKNYKKELETVCNELEQYQASVKKEEHKTDIKASALILLEYLEQLKDEDILEIETLHFLISKIYVKAFGKRINHQYQEREISIEYKNIDELIKEFINYEGKQDCRNIC